VGDDNLSYEDLLRIITLVNASPNFSEVKFKFGNLEVDLKRHCQSLSSQGEKMISSHGRHRPSTPSGLPPLHCSQQLEMSADSDVGAQDTHKQVRDGGHALESEDEAAQEFGRSTNSTAFRPGLILISSPMIGIFYRCPAPGTPAFVEIGQRVAPDTTVCIIDVMKLMTTIPAGHHGVVTDILIKDGEQVDLGQTLIVIDPTG
jgi:acetyl-CoA carboxylase biotin carboxyl carrier protein